MFAKIKSYFTNKYTEYEQDRIQHINEALFALPDLKPEQRFCWKCGKEMQGTFTDADFFQFHGKLGIPIYYMTVEYICPNGHKTEYRQGVNNYEGY